MRNDALGNWGIVTNYCVIAEIPRAPPPEWFADFASKDAGDIQSESDSFGGEYTKHPSVGGEADILPVETTDIKDEYDTKDLLAQLAEDVGDSEECRANLQNLGGDRCRKYAPFMRNRLIGDRALGAYFPM